MPKVLTMPPQSDVLCGHIPPAEGKVTTVSTAKLQVLGSAVLTQSSIENQPIVGCKITPPPASNVPCATVTGTVPPTITGGQSLKLQAGGQPVMLDTLSGQTSGKIGGVAQALLHGVANHNKLTAV